MATKRDSDDPAAQPFLETARGSIDPPHQFHSQ